MAAVWNIFADVLRKHPPARAHYLPGEKAPAAGALFRRPALGATLRAIADQGLVAFYAGPVAKELTAILQKLGGQHSLDDFASHASNYEKPISAKYRSYEVSNVHPTPKVSRR